MDGPLTRTIFYAAFVRVLWTIAVHAYLERTVGAKEYTPVGFAIERLAKRGASIHADKAILGLFFVPEQAEYMSDKELLILPLNLLTAHMF